MPRGKRADDGHEENRAVRAAPVGIDGGYGGLAGVSSVSTGAARSTAAGETFQWLLARTDGWLRCIPAGDGKQNYFKWKFSSGPWAGHYVMYVSAAGDWSGGIIGLADKLIAVDEGRKRPAHDTFYDPR